MFAKHTGVQHRGWGKGGKPALVTLAQAASRELIDDVALSVYDFNGLLWKFYMAISVSALRNVICWMMVLVCPLSLAAANTGSAVLRSQGGVWVNGVEVGASTVVFSGDVLETKPGFVANLDAEGSSVLIQAESIVKFQGNSLSLDHGSVSVGTSTSMSVHVKCIKVEPVSNERTQYDVADVSGTVQVAAHKSDVNITQGSALRKAAKDTGATPSSQSGTVHEGEQASREEATACGAAARPAGTGNGMNTKWLEIGGGGAAGVLVLCLLLCKGSSSSNVSPSQP